MVGVSVNSLNALYGSGGFAMDFFAGSHGIVSWSEGVGAFDAGRGPSLGAIFEIRSTAEAGYVFDNQVRTTFYVSHTSNDRVALKNPGSETMGFYVHVPVEMLTH